MFFLKKNYMYIILILILLIILAYATNITSIPESLILFENEELNLKSIFGVKIEETVSVGADVSEQEASERQYLASKNEKTEKLLKTNLQEKQYNLSLFGINLKTIQANIVPKTKVIPLGNLVGLKLYTKGVLVVGVSEIKGDDDKVYKPYEEAGIELGDTILEVGGEKVETTEELIACVSKCKGKEIKIKYESDGEIIDATMTPIKTSSNTYKIGLWVRDAAAGVGTLTFYDPSTNSCAALGHGIQDVDTGELVDISSGEFITSEILDIEKGEENNPGKIEGTIEDSKKIGEIYSNTNFGIYGLTTNKSELNIDNAEMVEVASRNEIKTGKASIICTLENGIRKEYEVQIEKIYINNNENNKSMVVKITDEELLNKTGGIIQGMSGSPILQNGKLVGALTHVFVSDPTKGYGVFADTMLQQLKNVN